MEKFAVYKIDENRLVAVFDGAATQREEELRTAAFLSPATIININDYFACYARDKVHAIRLAKFPLSSKPPAIVSLAQNTADPLEIFSI